MMRREVIQWMVVCAAVVFTTSCATPVYRLYNAGQRQEGDIAILRNAPGFGSSVYVDAVDGDPPPDKKFYGSKLDGRFRIHLLPGEHTLSVRYSSPNMPGWYSLGNQEVRFSAQAGKEYRVRASLNTNEKTWHAWVEEVDRNAK